MNITNTEECISLRHNFDIVKHVLEVLQYISGKSLTYSIFLYITHNYNFKLHFLIFRHDLNVMHSIFFMKKPEMHMCNISYALPISIHALIFWSHSLKGLFQAFKQWYAEMTYKENNIHVEEILKGVNSAKRKDYHTEVRMQ